MRITGSSQREQAPPQKAMQRRAVQPEVVAPEAEAELLMRRLQDTWHEANAHDPGTMALVDILMDIMRLLVPEVADWGAVDAPTLHDEEREAR